MPAGSVRLPELKQDIKVDTKDLVRAEAAAKRFKQSMNRNLQIDDSDFDRSLAGLEKKLDDFAKKNREIKLDLDLDTAKAREKLKQIRNEEVKVKVDADTEKAREKIKRLGRETVRVAVDATTTKAAAAIKRLSREKVQVTVDGETTRARAKIQALGGISVRPSVDPKTAEGAAKIRTLSSIQLRPKVDPSLVGAAAKIRSLSAIEIKPKVSPDLRGFRKSVLDFAKNVNVRLKVDVVAAKAEIAKLDRTKITVLVDADTRLAQTKINLLHGQTVRVRVDVDTDEAQRKIAALAASARAAVRDVNGLGSGLGGLSRNARLAARAIGTLSIAGVVAGGIGTLGAGAIGLAGALYQTGPAALALTGALGGLGVAAGGLAAIFKSNEGLKGSSKILRDAFEGIQNDLQRRVNPSILEFMRSVAGLAPIAREMVPPFAQAFNEVTQGFSRMLKDSTFQADLREIITQGIAQFRLFGEGGRNAIQGIISLAAATGPYITRLAEGFVEVTAEFRNWVAEARKTGELNFLLQNAFDILQSLGRTVRDLAVGFKQMFMAANFSGFTQTVLETLEGIAQDFRNFTRERAADVAAMFANLKGQFAGFRGLIASLADGIRIILTNIDLTPLMKGIQAIVPELANALTEFTNALARVAEQAAPAINSLLGLIRGVLPAVEQVVTKIVQNVTQVVNAVRPGIENFVKMLANIGDNVIPVIAGAARNLGAAFSTAMIVIRPIGEFLGSIVGLLGDMSGAAGIALAAFLGFRVLQGIFGGATQGASRLRQGLVNLANGTAASGKRVGVLQGAVRGLAQPFAAATLGAGRLGRGLLQFGQQLRVQQQLARQAGESVGRLAGSFTALEQSGSGILRSLGRLGQAFQQGGAQADQLSQRAQNAGRAIQTTDQAMLRVVSGGLRSLGQGLQETGTRLTNLAGNVTTTSQRMTAGLGAAVSQAGSMLGNFGQRIQEVGNAVSQRLGSAVSAGAGMLGRFGSTAASVARGGVSILAQGVQGVSGALGGPWGIAITGAIAVMTTLGQKSQEVAQQQQQLQQAFSQSGGQINDNIVKMTQASLESNYLAEASKRLGVSQTDVAQVVTQGGAALDEYVNTLTKGLGPSRGFLGISDQIGASFGDTDAQARVAAGSMLDYAEQVKHAQEIQKQQQDTLARNNTAMGQGRQASINLGEAMKTLGDETKSSSEKFDALKTAMDTFRGGTESAQDAAQKLNDEIRQAAPPIEGFNRSMVTASGSIDTFSQAGSDMRTRLQGIKDAALESAQAAFDAAGGTKNLGAANAAAAGEITKARDAVVKMLQQYGLAPDVIDKVVKAMGLVPEEVTSTLSLKNADQVQQQLTQVKNQLDQTPDKKPIEISVPLAPQVIQKLKDVGVQVREIPGANGQPAKIELTVPDDRVRAQIPKIIEQIEKPTGGSGPGGTPAMPTDVNTKPGEATIADWQKKIDEGGKNPAMPTDANTKPADESVDKTRTNIEGTEATLPVGGNLLVEQQVMAFVGRLNAYQAAVLPINANVQPGEQQALAWVARINAYPAAMLPISANVAPGEQIALAWVDRINAYPGAALPLSANITQLNQQYNEAYTFITNNLVAVPLAANIAQLNAQYAEAYNFITSNVMYIPVAGDFSQFFTVYDQVVQMVSNTPVYIPIYGQFMGIQGLGGLGMASGGIVANEKGRLIEYFDNGGMSAKDHAALKASSNSGENKYPNKASLDGMATAKGMGLTPMSANRAAIVAPNTWRVIGDRAQDDESYIPINNSARSTQILEETAKRMGYALEKYASGGFSSASPTAPSKSDAASSRPGGASQVVTNNNDAPLIGGDLVVTVPQDTPVNDAMNEALFQLRRVKRGGVYTGSSRGRR